MNMALSIDILEVATAVHAVAEPVRAVHSRISIDDMLVLTQQAAASGTGAACVAHMTRCIFLQSLWECMSCRL